MITVYASKNLTLCSLYCLSTIIGASLSEPHTSESNSGFFIYYIYIYLPYVFCKCKLNSFNLKHCARRSVWAEDRKEHVKMVLKLYGTRVLKERKIEKAEGEGSCQARWSNCWWKTSYLTAEKYPWMRKNGSWNPWGERRKITADEHQPARKVHSWNPEEREWRLQPLPKCITRRILYHIETVNYHSI